MAPTRSVTLRLGGDNMGARRAYEETNNWANLIESRNPTLHIGADLPESAVLGLQAQVDSLTDKMHEVHIGMDLNAGDLAKLAAINAALTSLRQNLEGRTVIGVRGFATTQAKLASLAASLETIGRMKERPEVSLNFDTHPLDALAKTFGQHSLGNIFNGRLWNLTTLHYIADGLIEVAAVAVPATIALGAFGAAGFKTFNSIYGNLKAIHTVATATNQVIAPMSQSFHDLQNAVRPQVMELWGEALAVDSHQTGLFGDVAKATGSILDNWGAHIAVLMTSSTKSVHGFTDTATNDLKILGAFFSTLGVGIAHIISVAQTTHIAEDLFQILTVVGKLFVAFTNLPRPIVATFLALHGIELWGKLAVGIFASLGTHLLAPWTKMAGVVATAGTKFGFFGEKALGVAKNMGVAFPVLDKMHTNLGALATEEETGAAKTGLLTGAMNLLRAVPVWGWVAIGAVALGGLVYLLSRAKDATTTWLDSMQTNLMKAPITNGISLLYQDIAKTTIALQGANKSMASFGHSSMNATEAIFNTGSAIQVATNRQRELSAGQKQQIDQANLLTYRLGLLAHNYGLTLPQAMAVAQMAGVKMGDMLNGSRRSLLLVEMQVGSIINSYKEMGQSSSMVGEDISALTYAESSQLANMQKLNQAYDTFTKNVAGPSQGFIAFAQSVVQFGTDAQTAGAKMNGFGGEVQKVAKKMTTPALQLQSDFQQTFNSAEQLFDAMRMAQAPSNVMVSAMKNAVAVLLPMTRGNKEALAQVSALAQEVGGPATLSMKQLAKWTGHTHDPMKQLQKAADNTGISIYNLNADAKKLSTTLNQDLNTMIAKVVLSTSNVQGAMIQYTNDLRNNTATTRGGINDRKNLYDDLMKVFHNSNTANGAIRTLTSGVLGLHSAMSKIKSEDATVRVDGRGHYTISGGFGGTQTGLHRSAQGGIAAKGLYIASGRAGVDDQLIMAQRGELVVPTRLVQSGAVDHLRGMIPGFSQGGFVGSVPGLSRFVTGFDNQFKQQFVSAMVGAMRSSMATLTSAFTGGAPAYGSSTAAMRFAQSMLKVYGWGSQWPALYALWERESGWNPYAVNPSSGAYGIPQALGHGHPFNLGDYANQIRWGLSYILSRYGSPNAAWGHEMSFGWYDKGGWLMPGLTLAMNNTGIPEPVYSPLTSPHAVGAHARSGDTFNITVQGDTNPDGAALAIIQKIRDYKRHHGNQPTGIG